MLNRLVLLSIMVLSSSSVPFARSQVAQSNPISSVEQELRALTHRWDEALVKRDLSTLERLLADDYTFAGTSKDAYLAMFKTPDAEYKTFEKTGISVRTYGEASLVFGQASVSGKHPGVDWFGSTFNFMDVWIRVKGQWRCVATMHDEIKGETSRGMVRVGPDVKASLVIVFKPGVTDEEVSRFWVSVLQVPGPNGSHKHSPGISGILRVPPIQRHEAIAVTFDENATAAERKDANLKIKASSLVYKVFEEVAPNEVRLN